jgi:O-antigen ligase
LGTFLIRLSVFTLFALYLLRHDAVVVRPTGPDLLVLALWALSAAFLARPGYPWISYQWFLHHSAAVLLYLCLRAVPGNGEEVFTVAGKFLLAAAAFELGLVLYQRFALGSPRPEGTLQNPNFLAEFLLYGGIAAFFAVSGTRKGAFARWRYPAMLGVFAAAVFLTRSRAAAIVAVAAWGYLLSRRYGASKSLALVALLVLGLLLVPNPLADRFRGTGDPFAYDRIVMWKAAWRIFLDHPLGVGVGHFKYYWHLVRDPVEGGIVRYLKDTWTPHSEFLSILSELGLPGGAAFLGLGAAGWIGLRRMRNDDVVPAGALMILFASFLHSFIDFNYHVFGLLLLSASALAAAGSLWKPLREYELRLAGPVRVAGLGILVAMAVYTGMVYAGNVMESRGERAVKAGRLAEAGLSFERAASTDPWRATAPDQASAVLFRRYEEEKKEEFLGRAIEWEMEAHLRNPLEYRYAERLGFLYAKAAGGFVRGGRAMMLEAALRSYDQAILRNPHSAPLKLRKALLLRAVRGNDTSRILVEEILREEPRYAKAWVTLGEFLEGSDPKRAVTAYENAVAIVTRYNTAANDAVEKEFLEVNVRDVGSRIRRLRGEEERGE